MLVYERKLDELGRIIIPKEIRQKLDIEMMGVLEIVVEDNSDVIILKRKEVK